MPLRSQQLENTKMMYRQNSNRTKNLMANFVSQPFTNHQTTPSWDYYAINKDKKYHLQKILNQGRANFTTNHQENGSQLILNSTDMEILYRYYYFQFHYTSSLYIYELGLEHLRNRIENKEFVFIDLGCGPFTSGIAFKEFCTAKSINTNMEFHGYDIAQVMLNTGNAIAQFSDSVNFVSQNNFHLDYRLINQLNIPNSKAIILNICYFLSAHTLDINEFLNTMKIFFTKNSKNQILIIYQNPRGLNSNWKLFKQRFSNFRTLRTNEGALTVQFDDVVGSWHPYTRPNRHVYFDYLTN